MNNKSEKIGGISVVLSAVLFGCMPLVTKIAYRHGSNAETAAFFRFLFGSLLLFVIVRFVCRESVLLEKRQLLSILKYSIPYALVPILLYRSYDLIDSGLATTLHFTYPVTVVLILALFCHRRMDAKQLICTALCVTGIVLLYRPNGQINTLGLALAAVSGVIFAVYIVMLGNSPAKTASPFVLSFWLSVFSSVEIGLLALCGGRLTLRVDAAGWGAQFLLALMTGVCALVLFQKGVVLCGEVKASLLSTFEPLTGLAVGLTFFHEAFTVKQAVGVVFILAAVLLLVLDPRALFRRKESDDPT